MPKERSLNEVSTSTAALLKTARAVETHQGRILLKNALLRLKSPQK